MTTRTLSEDETYEQLSLCMPTRSETFVFSEGRSHRRTRSDYGVEGMPAAAAAAVEPTSDHSRVSKRLSLDTRPTASTSQRPRISGEIPQLMITDDVGNLKARERARRVFQKAPNVDDRSSESSSDESERPQRRGRPQSAWNSRSGRRPQFTLSDVDAAGGDEFLGGGGCSDSESMTMMSRTSTTPKRTPGLRTSQIPVRTDRLYSTTTTTSDRTDDRRRRHSVFATSSHNITDAIRDMPRDPEVVEGGYRKSLSLPESFRRRSSTDDQEAARNRILARLAKSSEPPEAEMTSSPVSRRPHKLDPILSPDVNSEHLSRKTAVMTPSEVDFDGVTSGVGGGGTGGSCRLRPVVSRKARTLMMM